MVAVGLLGLGTVGSAVADAIRARYPPEVCEVAIAAVRHLDRRDANSVRLTSSALEVVEDQEVSVVIECIGPTPHAVQAVRRSLELGKPVITSNKTLVAEHGDYFSSLAAKHNTRFLYEASVAGAVPVIRVVRDYLSGVNIQKIRGVLNGTSGFVIDRLSGGSTLAQALRDAKHKGYAEADSTRDIDGTDATEKAVILHRLVFPNVTSTHVRTVGVTDWQPSPPNSNSVWRLVADISPDGIDVQPRRMTREDPLGRLPGVECGVTIITEFGQMTMTGPGAGGRATAIAVLSDLHDLVDK